MLNIFNIKLEDLKKIIKYFLMLSIMTFAALSVPKNMMSKMDALLVGLVGASTFVILDLTMPSICLK